MLRNRLIFGAIMIAALVGLIVLDDHLTESLAPDMTPGLLINLHYYLLEGGVLLGILSVLVILAARELHRLFHAAHAASLLWIPTAVCLILLAITFLTRHGLTANVSGDITDDYRASMTIFIFGFFLVCLGVMARRKTEGATAAIAASMLMIVYLGLLPQFLLRVRMWAPSGAAWLLLYAIIVVKVCDIGAFFTGRSFGKHKLIEWLSPKKTIEGLMGGIAAATLAAIGLAAAFKTWGPDRIHAAFPTMGVAAAYGALAALVGQTGDLVESLFKRDAAAKDSANAIPAFGGVLDVLDSLLLTAPLAYWMLIE